MLYLLCSYTNSCAKCNGIFFKETTFLNPQSLRKLPCFDERKLTKYSDCNNNCFVNLEVKYEMPNKIIRIEKLISRSVSLTSYYWYLNYYYVLHIYIILNMVIWLFINIFLIGIII